MTRASKRQLNIFIVEDNDGDARLISELLREAAIGDCSTSFVKELSEMQALDTAPVDVILLDLHLSELSPIATFKLVNSIFPKTPIIVLTGTDDDNLAARVMRLGAQDYLIKGTFGAHTLKRSINYSIERKKSQIRILRAEKKSRKLTLKTMVLRDEAARLQETNKAKDVFVSIASHQLRTPATAVKQYLGMLLEGYRGELTDEQRAFITTAYNSNERQLKIVDDLLRVARLDAGHVILHRTPTNINELLQSIIRDQQDTFLNRHQMVHFSPTHPAYDLNIDADNMRMVFENILDNAGKYSPEETSVYVTISVNKQGTTIAIKDQGIGISEADSHKLFQKFSRADSSFRRAPNGSGLGLYWAQEIVKLHGGIITFDSKLGLGSTFTIDLPHTAGLPISIPSTLPLQTASHDAYQSNARLKKSLRREQ